MVVGAQLLKEGLRSYSMQAHLSVLRLDKELLSASRRIPPSGLSSQGKEFLRDD